MTEPIGSPVAYWLGRFWMWLFGWQVKGHVPAGGKFVLVGAPHTSNWDFPFTLAAAAVLRLRISWLGKDSAFKGPLGPIMRGLGGIPIDRSSPQGLVSQIAARFDQSDQLIIAIAPSGTRRQTQYWKSGFYWIAHAAQVPILCGYLDYRRKRAGVGLSFVPTGDIGADMDRIREFYQDFQGKKPELATRVRLADEDA
ncbi:MAG: lysophospholipid acyltransferase family protein [Anaerolineae bacterium]